MIKEISDQTYAQETATGLVVIDFRLDFCSPCRAMDAILTKVSQDGDLKDQVSFVSPTINRHHQVAQALGVAHVPTVLIKKDGKIVAHFFNIRSITSIKHLLLQCLATNSQGVTS